jgi:hypothetical protein
VDTKERNKKRYFGSQWRIRKQGYDLFVIPEANSCINATYASRQRHRLVNTDESSRFPDCGSHLVNNYIPKFSISVLGAVSVLQYVMFPCHLLDLAIIGSTRVVLA